MFFLESFPFERWKVVTEQKTRISVPTFLSCLSYYQLCYLEQVPCGCRGRITRDHQSGKTGGRSQRMTPAQQNLPPAPALLSVPLGLRYYTPAQGTQWEMGMAHTRRLAGE